MTGWTAEAAPLPEDYQSRYDGGEGGDLQHGRSREVAHKFFFEAFAGIERPAEDIHWGVGGRRRVRRKEEETRDPPAGGGGDGGGGGKQVV